MTSKWRKVVKSGETEKEVRKLANWRILIMPAKLKEDIGEKFVITKGLDGCLFVYSQKEWQVFEEKLRTFPLTNKDARALMRFFLAGATECEIDKQGRFLISGNLREFAGLEKEVVIIGVLNKIEIWSKDKWQKYSEAENMEADEIAEKMSNLGI